MQVGYLTTAVTVVNLPPSQSSYETHFNTALKFGHHFHTKNDMLYIYDLEIEISSEGEIMFENDDGWMFRVPFAFMGGVDLCPAGDTHLHSLHEVLDPGAQVAVE